jgi:hypothetical protein
VTEELWGMNWEFVLFLNPKFPFPSGRAKLTKILKGQDDDGDSTLRIISAIVYLSE